MDVNHLVTNNEESDSENKELIKVKRIHVENDTLVGPIDKLDNRQRCKHIVSNGTCELDNNCKFSHALFDNDLQMQRFFEENVQYLIDHCRFKVSLVNYHDKFIQFLQKKIDQDPRYMEERGGPLP